MGIGGAVVQHQAHLHRVGCDALEVAALEGAAQAVELGDRLGEVGIDRVELLDGGEIGGVVLHDQGAFRGPRGADAAADRGADRGIFQIEPGAPHLGLAGGELGLVLRHGGHGNLVLGGGNGLRLHHGRRAIGLLLGEVEGRLRPLQAGFARLQLDLERLGIDLIERIARLHVAALLEQALDHDARHARSHVGHPRRRDAAWQLAHQGKRLGLDRHDADVGWSGLGSISGGGLIAGRQQQNQSEHPHRS